jgi:hypothetical protein
MMLLVVMLTLCVASLSGGLAMLAHTEQRIANAHLRAAQVAYASEAAVRLAVDTVAQAPAFPRWPASGMVGSLAGGARAMAVAPGELVDLDARTMDLNQAALRDWPRGADTPQWRLMGWGRLPGLSTGAAELAPRVAVWVADDIRDADGAAGEDANGALMLRAEAYGAGGAMRALLVHITRDTAGVRVLSWRAVP